MARRLRAARVEAARAVRPTGRAARCFISRPRGVDEAMPLKARAGRTTRQPRGWRAPPRGTWPPRSDNSAWGANAPGLQSQTLHQAVQGGAVHAESRRRDRAIAIGGVERRADTRDGGAVEIGLQGFVGLGRFLALGRGLDIALERKSIRRENFSAAHDH